ncbi:FAD-binding domain-containing protein [Mycena albidolilacea]|uniref:FAD-binding domain-containing protein n=1 Tax=Mycena albidolilacea TaxID=1033008 RepID=A0AAD7AGR1_9AGAR|nr:FAD-binding domain-containing protein [Mycena albidolilacea]
MTIPLVLLALLAGGAHAESQVPLTTAPTDIWTALSTRFGDRVFRAAPFSQPCFANATSAECASIQELYQNEKTRTAQASGYTWGQWETCQDTGAQCLLDFAVPTDGAATAAPNTCELGSVPDYFIDVRGAADVISAFAFSKETGIPLIVKNTGHDFKGRSSGQGSLALWTHNLKDISYDPAFVAEGCTGAYPGVTAGAGVQFFEAFAFAEAHNLTLVGGSDATVGLTGGFTMGGGHGVLSPVLGLGVDRVLEYKLVTPDGVHRTASACHNEDLFFALRGGGGGTFGVVLSATILAAPAAPVQVVVVSWPPAARSAKRTEALWALLAEHALEWADAGWGGYAMPELALFVTQRLSKAEADKSMAPLLAFADKLRAGEYDETKEGEDGAKKGVEGAMGIAMEFPSFLPFFTNFMTDAGGNAGAGKVGYSVSLTSRLVQRASFATPASRAELVSALMAASGAPAPDAPLMIIQITAPTAAHAADLAPGRTSVTPAWREAVYHVTSMGMWNWNATREEVMGVYDRTSRLMDHVRAVTPDAAYLNEADVYEPNHEVSFWGDHYPELATIKMKYDPDRLLDCWQCVGWNPDSERYSCYL